MGKMEKAEKAEKVRVFAPATTANVGPGFDIFGIALTGIGDIVEAALSDSFRGVRLAEVVADSDSESLVSLPRDEENLVFPVAKAVYDAAGRKDKGVEIRLVKRMGIGTGLGSSGSSSVAAAVAVNEVLGGVFSRDSPEMLAAVLEGEFVACGSRHADNVFPGLLGGFVFIEDPALFRFRKFDIGRDVFFVVVTPEIVVNTKEARDALRASPYNVRELVSLSSSVVRQYLSSGSSSLSESSKTRNIPASVVGTGSADVVSAYLEGTIEVMTGLVNNDVELLGRGTLKDGIVTPIRAGLIPGYYDVKKAALKAGAKGFSISGSGPSVFAVAHEEDAEAVRKAMIDGFERLGKKASGIISTVNNKGACVVE